MRSMISYTQAAMEGAMKVQDVIVRALAKKITWLQAAEIIGISDRQMRRWRERYEEFGFRGLFDRRRGEPSPKRVAMAVVEKVLGLYREKYFDLNVRHFHEKLQEEHQVEISYSWVKGLLQGAGLVAKGRKSGEHRWFQDERWYDLLVILDDANSEIYYAQLVEEEASVPVLTGLKEVVEHKGVFCALYSDRGSHFWLTPKAGEAVDHQRLTQVGRAMRELGVRMIPAYSPQARGRSERSFGTWQGRLPAAIRAHGEPGQHRELSELDSADRTGALAGHAGGVRRGRALTPGWNLESQLWAALPRSLRRARRSDLQPETGGRQGRGKDAPWKSPKADFPTALGNPAKCAGFPLSHRLGGCGRLTKTGHFTCYEKRTF